MIRSQQRALIVWLVLALLTTPVWAQTLPTAEPEAVGMSSVRLERLTTTLKGYVEADRVAGGVAIIARRGKVAYLEPFGMRDRESASPMADDSIFRIASQTKALTSVCIMILQERGQLLITDPIDKYLPEFKNPTVAVENAHPSSARRRGSAGCGLARSTCRRRPPWSLRRGTGSRSS